VTKFYVEAKSLSTELWDRAYLQQVIDYSYAKGVPWAVLTNFARTVVLYSEWKEPDPARTVVLDLLAEGYVSNFEKLGLLSKGSTEGRRLDSFAEEKGRKTKKWPIDKQLLKDLNAFRLDLAKDIRRLNDSTFREQDQALEETVQRVLDRLIFIRVAEDRGLEDRQLSLIAKGPESSAVKRLRELFHQYDDNFDSKLFQPHAADEVRMDGEAVQRVIRGLHETVDGSIRYDFDAIDADVLGVMYEQYLGLILRQTAKQAKLSDGAVNRKEQGIYYTPTWVADYIVRYGLMEALKRRGAKVDRIRILDPACGSGSFLLRAFDHVMQARNPSGKRVQSRFDPETAGPLLALRTSILTDNLFGVDLDSRAVEITQLNLMIRAAETRHRLPTLERNIRVGNSVIGDAKVDPETLDWDAAFPEAMKDGGFDLIIGNPPYVRYQSLSSIQEDYFRDTYVSARESKGNYDLYVLFVEKSLALLRPGGVAGFILPNKYLSTQYGRGLRTVLLREKAVLRIVDFRDYQVFHEAQTYTSLLFVRKGERRIFSYGTLRQGADPDIARSLVDDDLSLAELPLPTEADGTWNFLPPGTEATVQKLDSVPRRLADVAGSIFVGLQTSADGVYIVELLRTRDGIATIRSKADESEHEIELDILRPILKGKEVRRWGVRQSTLRLIYPYDGVGDLVVPIPRKEFATRYPKALAYFSKFREKLQAREGAASMAADWYSFVYPKNLDKFARPKILTQVLARHNSFALDRNGGCYFVGGGTAGGYGVTLKDSSEENQYYVLGVLNSRPIEFYHHLNSTPFANGFFAYGKQYIANLPIPEATAAQRAAISALARSLSEACSRSLDLVPGTDQYRKSLDEVDKLESQLDKATLDLFGISQEEEKLLPAPVRWSP
jgi:type I restriction-modification system DNA methylase subunit